MSLLRYPNPGMPPGRFATSFDDFLQAHGVRHFVRAEVADAGRTTTLDATDSEKRLRASEILGHALPPGRYTVELQPPSLDLWTNVLRVIEVVAWLRAENGAPVDVSGGYRDPLYNVAVGGATSSQHMRMAALDISARGREPLWVARKLLEHPDADRLGIGLYNTFTHVDTRGSAARWPRSNPWWA